MTCKAFASQIIPINFPPNAFFQINSVAALGAIQLAVVPAIKVAAV